MRILIAGGGTGGHIYPALAVARSLRAHRPDIELRWLGGHRGLEREIVPGAGIELERLLLRSLRTVDFSLGSLLDPFRLAASFPQALDFLAGWRPAAIATTGGYVAIPTLVAAAILRIPTLLWEGNVVPGRSTRATARLARAIAVAFEPTCRTLGGRCYVTGAPTRPLAGLDPAAARERLGLPAEASVVLVFGGSQAVRRFDRAVESALGRIVERVVLLHVTGNDGYAEALRRRDALPEGVQERYRPYRFLRDEMADALAAADLVVGRAGSSTLAEVTAVGAPLVVVPYPHAAGHQRLNAELVARSGAALLIEDAAFDGDALVGAVALLDDARRVERMRAASRRLGRPGAADAVAEIVLALADRRELPSQAAVTRIAAGPAGARTNGATGATSGTAGVAGPPGAPS
jgi:UDP-N-acetylglucosamine--N-acetylmuramyl-(pentapeptide) pyrophosphoryl-undecaprenol N-acetylglucosamine transferase